MKKLTLFSVSRNCWGMSLCGFTSILAASWYIRGNHLYVWISSMHTCIVITMYKVHIQAIQKDRGHVFTGKTLWAWIWFTSHEQQVACYAWYQGYYQLTMHHHFVMSCCKVLVLSNTLHYLFFLIIGYVNLLQQQMCTESSSFKTGVTSIDKLPHKIHYLIKL